MLQAEQILRDRYQIKQQLGFNAVRQTWLAQDLTTSEQVVVKLLAFGGAVQWDELKLFEREAQILQQLDHDRIPKYRDYFSIDDRFLWFGLVQEYILGHSLKDVLQGGKRFTEEEIRSYGKEILSILTYLHSLNPPVLHRDIKPSNLILGEDNQVYLVDFGAVQDKAAVEGATFTVVGTYGYAPMEQFGGRAIPASDLYALGATLVHLITRTSPGDLPTENLRMQFRDRVSCSSSLVHWLEKLTEPALEKRFQTASEALEALLMGENKVLTIAPHSKGLAAHLVLPADTSVKITRTEKYLILEQIPGIYKLPFAKSKLLLTLSLAGLAFLTLATFPLSAIIILAAIIFDGTNIYNGESRFLGMKLELYDSLFILQKECLGFPYRKEAGRTNKIQEITLHYHSQTLSDSRTDATLGVTSIKSVSGVAIISASTRHSFEKHIFGKGLSEAESNWVIREIQDWLSSKKA